MKTKVFYLTTKLMVVVVLIAVLAVKAFAGTNPKISLVPYAPERAVISVENFSNTPYEMYIEDASGNVVYYKERAKTGDFYSRLFDFKNLRDGDYKVVVKNNLGEYNLPFHVENRKVVAAKTNNDLSPYFEVKNGVLKLSMLNHTNDNVELKFKNGNGVFYTKSLGNDFSITAGFNIDRLENGDYEVEVKSGKNVFSYNFEK